MTQVFDILLWAGAIIWIVLLIQGLINAILVRDLAGVGSSEPREWPLVSYLVPARNEEAGIRQAVTSFCTQDYPALEVIVVNDRSTDRTGTILSELQGNFGNLKVVDGVDPPPDWLGKPNALENGLRHAGGEWILMTDADAVHAPDVVRRAVAYGLHDQAGMVVVRPRHVSGGFLEAVLMCGVNFFFFVVTPIFLVRHSRSPLFATGSPVLNLMRRDALRACGDFACLRQAVVDDLEIGFCIKRAGYRLAICFAGNLINHRMYNGALETVRGFGKTTYPTIRSAPWILPLYLLVGIIVSFLPYLGLANGVLHHHWSIPAMISLVAMHVVFAGLAWRYREPWYIAFCNPLREVGWLWIFIRSFVVYCRKGLVWRGRSYPATS